VPPLNLLDTCSPALPAAALGLARLFNIEAQALSAITVLLLCVGWGSSASRCSDSFAPTPCTIVTAWRARPTTACRLRTESVGSRTDIENWRPETRAGNWSDVTKNSENYASEIPHRLANSRECRAYFCEPDIACRDGTGWLGS
jgi:hypothetical protein